MKQTKRCTTKDIRYFTKTFDMTPKIIELKQAPVILVELPTDIRNLKVNNARNKLEWFKTSINKTMSRGRVTYSEYIDLPYGCWAIVGILSDLTEEQFAECVDVYEVSESINIPKMRFYQMLESEKVYTEDSLRGRPNENNDYYSEDHVVVVSAQSSMIDPARTVVLVRKEG